MCRCLQLDIYLISFTKSVCNELRRKKTETASDLRNCGSLYRMLEVRWALALLLWLTGLYYQPPLSFRAPANVFLLSRLHMLTYKKRGKYFILRSISLKAQKCHTLTLHVVAPTSLTLNIKDKIYNIVPVIIIVRFLNSSHQAHSMFLMSHQRC